jgi:hypothetical protein
MARDESGAVPARLYEVELGGVNAAPVRPS